MIQILLEWYKNGIAEAYSIFLEKVYQKSEDSFLERDPVEEFERLKNNREEFEKFLDSYKDEPWKNIRFIPKKQGLL